MCAVPGADVLAKTMPSTNWASEMTAATTPGDAGEPGGHSRSGPARGPGQGDRADRQPGDGHPLGAGELPTTAVPCPASAAMVSAPEAVSLGLGAATDRPAIQDS